MTSPAEPSEPRRPPASAWQVPPDRKFSLDDIIPGPVLKGLVRIVRLPAGPIILALLFGLIVRPSGPPRGPRRNSRGSVRCILPLCALVLGVGIWAPFVRRRRT